MDDPGGSTYVAAFVCLFLSAFFSGSESALFSADEVKLKSNYANHKALKKVLSLKESSGRVLSSILLGNTLVNVLFSSLIASIVYFRLRVSHSVAEMVATLTATVLVLIFGEITPKLLSSASPERASLRLAPWLCFLKSVMGPFSWLLEKLAFGFIRFLPYGERESSELVEARILGALDFGETSGAIRSDEKEMIHGVIEAQELEAKDIMIPRPKMIVLQEDKSSLEMLKLMLRYGYSRIPVYSDSRDNITGVVTFKDLATFIGERPNDWEARLAEIPSRSFATPPYFVPETKNVSDLFHEMKSKGVYMAIVVDEFDGVSGLVTLEDLMEEIVGDIHDEYDSLEQDFRRLGEDSWEVAGSMSLAELEDATGISIEVPDCDSVAGLVMKCLDRVPEPGDAFCLIEPKVCLEVQAVRGPKIEKVLIQKIEGETEE
ncbi:MAG: HlyC/CorC family transporter [Candidatus Fermentithermobacillus carboniphilus]|uniref:HlyC/CorC family transporter n=1 Tax=Candidatus Fermentithermobacillus carboniphilus TaxID=3085328 RepID=A0AAT9LE47_9FIRM|nr:MAG: HlyC/CorC family transporter [Candidatus Fermentithermobacillus carboniphilus]